MDQKNNKIYLINIFLKDVYSKFGFLSIFFVILMSFTGLIEGLSYTLLFPLLNIVGVGGNTGRNIFSNSINNIFQIFRFPISFQTILGCIIIAALIQYLLFILQSWLMADMQNKYMAIWRKNLFSGYINAKWPFFLKSKQSDLINNIIQETNRVGGGFYLICQIASAAIIAVIYLILSICICWQITAGILAFAMLFLPLIKKFIGYSHVIGEKIGELNSELQFKTQEYLFGAKIIKATNSEEKALDGFNSTINRFESYLFKSSFLPNLMRAFLEFFGIVVLCIILYASIKVLNVDFASVAVLFVIFFRFIPRFFALQQNLSILFVYLPAISVLESSEREASANEEKNEKKYIYDVPAFERGVDMKIDNLHFFYNEKNKVLSNISIAVPAGKTIAIVGSSGSGKTTLVDCILRLLKQNSGAIYLNDMNIEDMSLNQWRRIIGYVSQDTFLFNNTIRNNILWGSPQAKNEEMIKSARLANAHDFIMALPDGYDTVVGDRGIRLSGGQRQRIGLARALISEPSLLLLDEATSNLDAESEKCVQESIEALFGQITVVVIAHRFSTVKNADYIYVLEAGKIVEEGSWNDLLKMKGRFNYLWDLQRGG